ncbi:MAG: hypothetical protein D6798_03320 [Deltaproteobacteria bacterium]|nr:MAG: hypothetical protein D6798_03320 [Deltaproteobacteria bacterium]
MRGLGGMAKGLMMLLASLGVPTWVLPAVAFGALALMLPRLMQTMEEDRPRRMVKRAWIEDGEKQREIEREALQRASGSPTALAALAREAIQQGRRSLAEAAIERLRQTGTADAEVQRLEQAMNGPLPATSMEAAIIIERLLDNGLLSLAEAKLARFRGAWPDDTELAELAARVEAARSGAVADGEGPPDGSASPSRG